MLGPQQVVAGYIVVTLETQEQGGPRANVRLIAPDDEVVMESVVGFTCRSQPWRTRRPRLVCRRHQVTRSRRYDSTARGRSWARCEVCDRSGLLRQLCRRSLASRSVRNGGVELAPSVSSDRRFAKQLHPSDQQVGRDALDRGQVDTRRFDRSLDRITVAENACAR